MARFAAIYELKGVHGLEAALERAGDEVRKQVEIASRNTCIAIVAQAKALAPRDRGDLIASISFQGKGLTWRVGILDHSIPSRGGSNPAHLNPWVYGVWYEYGFVTRNIAARPFIGPAARAEEGAHEQRIAQALNTGLAKAA